LLDIVGVVKLVTAFFLKIGVVLLNGEKTRNRSLTHGRLRKEQELRM